MESLVLCVSQAPPELFGHLGGRPVTGKFSLCMLLSSSLFLKRILNFKIILEKTLDKVYDLKIT